MHALLLLCIQYTIRNWSTLHMIDNVQAYVTSVAYPHEMTFPVYYKLMYFYTYIYMQATYRKSFTCRKSHVGRGIHALGSMCTTDSVLLSHHNFFSNKEKIWTGRIRATTH